MEAEIDWKMQSNSSYSALLYGYRHSYVMRPLRFSINVTLDGCCDHRAMFTDEEMHRHAAENLAQADALLFGRVTYEMMEAGWGPFARTGARPDWMEPFARTIRRGEEVRRFQGRTASAAVHRSYGCWNSKFLMTTSTSSPSVGPAWAVYRGRGVQSG